MVWKVRAPETTNGSLRKAVLQFLMMPLVNKENPGHFLSPVEVMHLVERKGLTIEEQMKDLHNIGDSAEGKRALMEAKNKDIRKNSSGRIQRCVHSQCVTPAQPHVVCTL